MLKGDNKVTADNVFFMDKMQEENRASGEKSNITVSISARVFTIVKGYQEWVNCFRRARAHAHAFGAFKIPKPTRAKA